MDLKDKYFIRLGPVSGQKQGHKGRVAPAKRGIWALPVGVRRDLVWMGGGNIDWKAIEKKLLKIFPDANMTRAEQLEGVSWKDRKEVIERLDRELDEYCKVSDKLHKEAIHKKYKRIYLPMDKMIYTRLSTNKKFLETEYDSAWFQCSVREYWRRYVRYYKTFGCGEFFEIFIEM